MRRSRWHEPLLLVCKSQLMWLRVRHQAWFSRCAARSVSGLAAFRCTSSKAPAGWERSGASRCVVQLAALWAWCLWWWVAHDTESEQSQVVHKFEACAAGSAGHSTRSAAAHVSRARASEGHAISQWPAGNSLERVRPRRKQHLQFAHVRGMSGRASGMIARHGMARVSCGRACAAPHDSSLGRWRCPNALRPEAPHGLRARDS